MFGANWCEDCRALDKALQGTSHTLIQGKFDVVKIDVGNFDKNLELDARYGHPIKTGIPAVVVVDADNQVIYSTKGGELANARRMGEQGIYVSSSPRWPRSPLRLWARAELPGRRRSPADAVVLAVVTRASPECAVLAWSTRIALMGA